MKKQFILLLMLLTLAGQGFAETNSAVVAGPTADKSFAMLSKLFGQLDEIRVVNPVTADSCTRTMGQYTCENNSAEASSLADAAKAKFLRMMTEKGNAFTEYTPEINSVTCQNHRLSYECKSQSKNSEQLEVEFHGDLAKTLFDLISESNLSGRGRESARLKTAGAISCFATTVVNHGDLRVAVCTVSGEER